MPAPDPVKDAIALAERAALLLDHVARLENQAREMRASGSTPAQISKINAKIIAMLVDANKTLNDAKYAVEYAQSDFKENNPSKLPILQQRFAHLNLSKLSAKMGHMQERILLRVHPPTTNPEMEDLKSAPKPPRDDPNAIMKILPLVSNAFDTNGIVKEKSLKAIINTLTPNEKRLFINELANRIINNDHSQLNVLKALEQLSIHTVPEQRDQFMRALKNANHDRTMDILKNINAPTTPLPKSAPAKRTNDDMLYTQPVAKTPTTDDTAKAQFQQRVEKAVDGGFKEVQRVLKTLPADERLDFIIAAKEEVANRKLKEAFEAASVPTDEPQGPRR